MIWDRTRPKSRAVVHVVFLRLNGTCRTKARQWRSLNQNANKFSTSTLACSKSTVSPIFGCMDGRFTVHISKKEDVVQSLLCQATKNRERHGSAVACLVTTLALIKE